MAGPAEAVAPLRAAARPTIAQLTQRLLLARHAPAAVAIDREHRIVYFHGDTTAYLFQPSGEPTHDLRSMAREHVRGAIHTALQQAAADNSPATCRDGFLDTEEGRFRIEVIAEPLNPTLQEGYFLVSFHRLKESPPPAEVLNGDHDVADLQSELNRLRDELKNMVEELQATNEEARASSEEAMSINEELQSTNEELETSKEELQSLNEELTTVNVQLHIKMEEHQALAADLNSLLSSTNIAVIFLDPRFRIRRYTPTMGDLIELIQSDVGRPLADLKLKFDDPTLLADCQAVLDKLTPAERQVATSSGKVYMRRVQPYRTTDNRIDGIVITFIDVSALNRAETSQRQTESRFRQVIDGARDFAMLLMDPQGKIVTWNAGAERLLGWTRDKAIGKSASMIYVGDDAEAQQGREMEKAIRDGRAEDETWHQRKDGTRIWGSGVLTALHDDAGQLTGFVKVLRDDTARRDAETDRDQLLIREQSARKEAEQASYVKDQFLARLSHELRTPLSSILTWSEMLQHGSMGPDETVDGLKVIERSALSQAQLLNDLLEVSRIASGKMRLERSETKLPALVRLAVEALKPIAEERGVILETNLQPEGCQLRADPDRLRQVVSNLLTNALKFTQSGGRVTIEVSRQGDLCQIVVTDTGQGIEPEFLPHIFTPFSQADFSMTRSYGGLGLGLSISKELVELHGGTIEAHSEGSGRGATFIVRLPASGMPSSELDAPEEANGEAAANSLQDTKILLVEDEPLTLDSLSRVLRNYGADVATATTAEAAVESFAASPPHVIISDVGLPREDGYQLLQRVRTLEKERGLPPTPAIALSAFAGVKHRRQAREAGFDKHLPKPTKVAQLVNTISQLLVARDET
jgi:two-component system CheB/CheR fusion protein